MVMNELPYLTAFLLGGLHALEADHMAAVTSFAVQKPEPRAAARFGLQWAAGHGSSILLVGMLLIFIGMRIPENATGLMERVVGLTLIGLGAWTIVAVRRAHRRSHTHAPTFVGLVHGFAGAAAAVALVPLALFDSAFNGVAYLLLFGIGTALSMCAYALFAGYLASRATRVAESFGRAVGLCTGFGTIMIGVVWLIR
jgi:sulfite exporter TauE/SafE